MEEVLTPEEKAKARWVADLMIADKVKPEQLCDELCFAYLDAVGRKIKAINERILTRPQFARDFKLLVATVAKGENDGTCTDN